MLRKSRFSGRNEIARNEMTDYVTQRLDCLDKRVAVVEGKVSQIEENEASMLREMESMRTDFRRIADAAENNNQQKELLIQMLDARNNDTSEMCRMVEAENRSTMQFVRDEEKKRTQFHEDKYRMHWRVGILFMLMCIMVALSVRLYHAGVAP